MRQRFAILIVAAMGFTLFSGVAYAKDHGRGQGQGHRVAMRDDGGNDHDRDDRISRRADRDRDRDAYRNNVFARRNGLATSSQPWGWSQGRKTGWGNCDLPPGLAKKEGCNSLFGRRTGRIYRQNAFGYDGDRDDNNVRDGFARGSAPLSSRRFPAVRDEDRAPNPRSIFQR